MAIFQQSHTIDELNNDFKQHGKEYPTDIQSMMTWLMKRRGSGGPSKKEDDNSDDVISFAQIQKDRIKCHNCGEFTTRGSVQV